jgi:hypothetical protein
LLGWERAFTSRPSQTYWGIRLSRSLATSMGTQAMTLRERP